MTRLTGIRLALHWSGGALLLLLVSCAWSQDTVKESSVPRGASTAIEKCPAKCRCRRMTEKVQMVAEAACGKQSGAKRLDCFGSIPFHCDLIDMSERAITDFLDSISAQYVYHDLFWHEGNWSYCSIHCRLGDCACDQDGAKCHVGHKIADHEKSKGKP